MTNYIYSILVKKLVGKATDEDEQLLQQWLDADDNHQQEYDRLMENDDFSERYAAYNQFDDEAAWQRFAQQHSLMAEKRVMPWRRYLLRAAAVVILFVVGGLFYQRHTLKELPVLSAQAEKAMLQSQETGHNEAMLTIGNSHNPVAVHSESMIEQSAAAIESEADFDQRYTLTTESGKEFWITLDDGSKIHLNYATQLKYPVKFDEDNRTIYIKGEAFLQVAKDKSRPFRVVTDQGVATVYGTSFNVNTTEKPGITQVVLVEGSVGLTPVGGKEIMMVPGQLGEMRADVQGVTLSKIDTDIFTSWNEGYYKFAECPLQKLMQVLGHWYGKRVRFENKEASGCLFTGSIGRYKSLSSALHAISFATGLTIEQDNKEIIIR